MADTPTSDKEKALLMALDMEKRGKEDHLPYLLIIACPDSGEWVRCSQSLRRVPQNCEAFAEVTLDYLQKITRQ